MQRYSEDEATDQMIREAMNTPSVRRARWLWRNAFRRAAGKPLTGAYYWAPVPKIKSEGWEWELLIFYDLEYGEVPGDAAHVRVWLDVMKYLAHRWHKPERDLIDALQGSLYGLPRGRVDFLDDGQIGIFHGNDAPVADWLTAVKKAFVLDGMSVPAFEQERMFPGHPRKVRLSLGIDEGLAWEPSSLTEDRE